MGISFAEQNMNSFWVLSIYFTKVKGLFRYEKVNKWMHNTQLVYNSKLLVTKNSFLKKSPDWVFSCDSTYL